MSSRPPRTVRFLCTGHYDRNRFAERLFNGIATDGDVPWRAEARGLAADGACRNGGPSSPHALADLAARGLSTPPDSPAVCRPPEAVQIQDSTAATRCVAVQETGHRPMFQARFPAWADRVIDWPIDDIDRTPPRITLTELEAYVRARVAERRVRSRQPPAEPGVLAP